jgi:hypothetical protein
MSTVDFVVIGIYETGMVQPYNSFDRKFAGLASQLS